MKPARKLLAAFLAATLVPAGLAGWLAWRLLEQDRVMAGERLREIRDHQADEAVQTLSPALAALEQDARRFPAGAVKALGGAPSIHPDGKRVLFSAANPIEEIWMQRLPLN